MCSPLRRIRLHTTNACRGNALVREQKLWALGVDPKKSMSAILLSGEKHAAEAHEDELGQAEVTLKLITSNASNWHNGRRSLTLRRRSSL